MGQNLGVKNPFDTNLERIDGFGFSSLTYFCPVSLRRTEMKKMILT